MGARLLHGPTPLRLYETLMRVLARSISASACPSGPLMTGLASELLRAILANPSHQDDVSSARITLQRGTWMPQAQRMAPPDRPGARRTGDRGAARLVGGGVGF